MLPFEFPSFCLHDLYSANLKFGFVCSTCPTLRRGFAPCARNEKRGGVCERERHVVEAVPREREHREKGSKRDTQKKKEMRH